MEATTSPIDLVQTLAEPTRLRIRWSADPVLDLETDAGRQTRQLRFASAAVTAP